MTIMTVIFESKYNRSVTSQQYKSSMLDLQHIKAELEKSFGGQFNIYHSFS